MTATENRLTKLIATLARRNDLDAHQANDRLGVGRNNGRLAEVERVRGGYRAERYGTTGIWLGSSGREAEATLRDLLS